MIALPHRPLRDRSPLRGVLWFGTLALAGGWATSALLRLVAASPDWAVGALLLLAPLQYGVLRRARRDARAWWSYRELRCRILDDHVAREPVTLARVPPGRPACGPERESFRARAFRPEVSFAFVFCGRPVQATRYDTRGGASASPRQRRAILAHFAPGAEAPCWVPPAAPEEAVLVRRSLWPWTVPLLPYSAVAVSAIGALGAVDSLLARLAPDLRARAHERAAGIQVRVFLGRHLARLESGDDAARQGAEHALARAASPSLVPALTDLLGASGSAGARRAAARLLGWIGEPAALPVLHGALRDPSAVVRAAAAGAAGDLQQRQSIGPLVGAVADREQGVVSAVFDALERIDPGWARTEEARAGVPALCEALRSGPWGCRRAAEALGEIGDPGALPALLEAANDPDVAGHASYTEFHVALLGALGRFADPRALESLRTFSSGGHAWRRRLASVEALADQVPELAVPALLDAMEPEGDRVREAAAQALGELGHASAIGPLAGWLIDGSRPVSSAAAAALAAIDPGWANRPEVVPLWAGFVMALCHRDTHEPAARTLTAALPGWQESPHARAAVPEILRAELNPLSAEVLGAVRADEAIDALVIGSVSTDPELREASLEALERIDPAWATRPEAAEAIPELVARLAGHAGAALLAARRLGQLAHQRAVPGLVRACIHREEAVRREAERALEATDPAWLTLPVVAEAVPELARALEEGWPEARRAAAGLLGRLGQRAREAVPALVATLRRPDATLRRAGLTALEEIDRDWTRSTAARGVMPMLCECVSDPDPEVQHAAEQALERIDLGWYRSPQAQASLPAHLERLTARDVDARQAAWQALERIDVRWHTRPEARAHTRALILASTASDPGVRDAAEEALARIAPDWRESEAVGAVVPALVQQVAEGLGAGRRALQLLATLPGERVRAPLVASLPLADFAAELVALLDRIDPGWTERPEARELVPALIEDLGPDYLDASRSMRAIALLARLGDARAIAPLLDKHSNARDAEVRDRALRALARIDPDWAGRPEAEPSISRAIDRLGSPHADRDAVRDAITLLGAARHRPALEPLHAYRLRDPHGLGEQVDAAIRAIDA